jgi:hypothetical protein
MSPRTYIFILGVGNREQIQKGLGCSPSRGKAGTAGPTNKQSNIKTNYAYGLTDDEYLRAAARGQTQTSCWRIRTQYQLP